MNIEDAGAAVTRLQSLVGSTFGSSHLVLTARRLSQSVNETGLEDLRNKHRPSVLSSMKERAKGLGVYKDSGLASKLYNFKREPEPLVSINNSADEMSDVADGNVNQEDDSADMDAMFARLTVNSEIDSLPDPKDQVATQSYKPSFYYCTQVVVICDPVISILSLVSNSSTHMVVVIC